MKRHLREGEVQAYVDQALAAAERAQVEAHLASCARCADRVAAIAARSARVDALFAGLDPQSAREPVSAQAARHSLDHLLETKKETTMGLPTVQTLFSRRYRWAWGVALVLAMIVMTLTVPPLRALAGEFLALFRVEQITFIDMNPEALPDEETLESVMGRLDTFLEGQVEFAIDGEPQEVAPDAVAALVPFAPRFPAGDADLGVLVQPGFEVEMTIDLPRLRALLRELGYEDVRLPRSLDGQTVSVEMEASVLASYGECDVNTEAWAEAQSTADFEGTCFALAQLDTPSVVAPPGLDMDQLGQLYLRLLGMEEEEAARFSSRVDWETTLVVPVPSFTGLTYEDVVVDGVPGTLLRPPSEEGWRDDYVLMWVKNEVVYALMGTGDVAEGLALANSMR